MAVFENGAAENAGAEKGFAENDDIAEKKAVGEISDSEKAAADEKASVEKPDMKEKTDKGKRKKTKGESSNREQDNLVFSATKQYANNNEQEVCGGEEKEEPAPVDKPTDVASTEPSWNGILNDNEVDAKTSPED